MGLTNIGVVSSSNYHYAGGLIGYLGGNYVIVVNSINAGMVDGALAAVGGIVGYLEQGSGIHYCMNTNKIFGGSASY